MQCKMAVYSPRSTHKLIPPPHFFCSSRSLQPEAVLQRVISGGPMFSEGQYRCPLSPNHTYMYTPDKAQLAM